MHQAISGSDVVVAIIGGTLLALALTRPSPAWVQKLDSSSRGRVEVMITMAAFVMAGYAYGSLFVVLHHQLGQDVDKLLRVAAVFFALYALYIHFEPFFDGGGWLRGASAVVLYLNLAVVMVLVGVVLVEYTLTKHVESPPLLLITIGIMVPVGGLYGLARRPRQQTITGPQPDLAPASSDET